MSSKEEGMRNAGEMFKAFMEQQGMTNNMKNAAHMMFDLYSELKKSGFTESQAMAILLTTIGGAK